MFTSHRTPVSPPMRRLVVAAAALGALAACNEADPVAPHAPDPLHAVTVTAGALAAVADAQARLTPSLANPALRQHMGAALTELRLALDNGQAVRSRRALDHVRALLTTRAPEAVAAGRSARGLVSPADADGASTDAAVAAIDPALADEADLESVRLTLELIGAELTSAAALPAPPTPGPGSAPPAP